MFITTIIQHDKFCFISDFSHIYWAFIILGSPKQEYWTKAYEHLGFLPICFVK